MTADSFINKVIQKNGEIYTACFGEFELHSAYQPIVSLIHHRAIGFEGLVRPFHRGKASAPRHFFDFLLDQDADLGKIDRICRNLHLKNASGVIAPSSWLFLNVDNRTITADLRAPEEICNTVNALGFRPENIVLEILEKNIADPVQLSGFVAHYKSMGFKVAVDDFGAGESNFERIATIHPSIVKLDRSIIHDTSQRQNGLNILKKVVSLLREMGCMVLIEGVETEQHALFALETEADLVQGFYFSQPSLDKPEEDEANTRRELKKLSLLQRYNARIRQENNDKALNELHTVFRWALSKAAINDSDIPDFMFPVSHVQRFYVLDHQGFQVGNTWQNPKHELLGDHEFHPLKKCDGACWSRRDFFVEAIKASGTVYSSEPYLSLPEETLSITFSATYINAKGLLRVLCMDVDAEALNKLIARGEKHAVSVVPE
ncbi:MAG: EAL domain-containing protein [Pseudomonadales bacterium]|nr:EAL domain-containing protein [Pseudomonadales bacterium]